MHSDKHSDQEGRQEPTLDGERLRVGDLNLPRPQGEGRFRRLLNNLSLFLAGMYTGESCAGTPHSHRRRDRRADDSSRSGGDL